MIRTGEAQFVSAPTPTAAVSMPVLPDVRHFTKFGKDFLAGATAAAIAKTVMAPAERVKIILQLQSVQSTITAEKRYNGILDCFMRVPREQGLISFWRGNGVNIVRACSQESLSFAFKDLFKIWFLHGVDHKKQYSRFLVGNVVGGGLSGVVTYCIIYPLDFIRTRLAIDMGKGASREFTGFIDCSRKIVKVDGVVGLYRGFYPSLQYIFIFRSVYFGLFDSGKVLLAKDGEHIGLGRAFCLAQAVSFAAGMTSYPLDTVRRRLMMQAGKKDILYKGTLDCAMKIWRTEGTKAFFNGALMNAIRGFGGALILSVYTQLARYM
uniref:ADP/ATP translocase n=2 Tax=Steinernema glaseri TaxID=37863 RepID=A0A1I7ZYH8_9BILA